MQLILEKKHENRIEFAATGINASLANLIRRYVIARIPVLAIDKITVYENTSSFWDEYIAHRIGLMPIVTPEKLPKNTEIIFTLDAEGPKVVYSGDLKCTDKEIKMAKENIPLITLAQNQRIKLEGSAVLGTATRHAKFQAGLLSYGIQDGKFEFFVESFFNMPPAELIERGCDEILNDLDKIEKAISTSPKKKKEKE